MYMYVHHTTLQLCISLAHSHYAYVYCMWSLTFLPTYRVGLNFKQRSQIYRNNMFIEFQHDWEETITQCCLIPLYWYQIHFLPFTRVPPLLQRISHTGETWMHSLKDSTKYVTDSTYCTCIYIKCCHIEVYFCLVCRWATGWLVKSAVWRTLDWGEYSWRNLLKWQKWVIHCTCHPEACACTVYM